MNTMRLDGSLDELPFRLLAQNMRDAGIFLLHQDGRTGTWNNGAAASTGYTAAEILGRHVSCLCNVTSSGRAWLEDSLRLAQENGHDTKRGLCTRKDGTEFWAEAAVSSLRGEDGGQIGFSVILRDLSAAHLAEAALRESEQRFRTMADSAPVLLWMAGLDGLCNFFNEGWLRFTGRTMPEELGNGWAEGVHAEDFQRCMHVFLNHFVTHLPFSMEYRLRRTDGEYRWVLDQGRPRFAPDGSFLGFIGSCIDITEQREAQASLARINTLLEERVAQRTAQLAAANRELEAFSYSVAHDLRTPLRQILGFSKILVEDHVGQLDDEAMRCLDKVQHGARHMSFLVDDLLNLSRVGQQALNRRDVPLDSVVRAALAELESEHSGRQVDWQIGELPTVNCDPGLMKQVFVNLLANALKYSRPRERAVIQVARNDSDSETVILVRDNGIGFDMRYAGKLFGVFQRLHKAEDFEGTGVGLAIVERIVSKHNGRVWAHAEPDRGATFFFTVGSISN